MTEDRGILITTTKPITEYYDPAQAAIMDAEVFITEMERGNAFRLYPSAERLGIYYNDSLIPQARKTYRLEVKLDRQWVTAMTIVPNRLEIKTELNDGINYYYPRSNQVLPPIYLYCDDPEQIIYVEMFCNQTFSTAEYIQPFNKQHLYPQNQEEYDGGRNGPPRHVWAIMRYKDLIAPSYMDQHVIYWYQAMFVFYGSNTMQVLAIDDNFHRFLYSEHPEFSGGVEGGIGVFGSVSGKKFEFLVVKD